MMHPSTHLLHINDAIGVGVFATAPIPQGTIVYVKDALEVQIGPDEYHTMHPLARVTVDRYSYKEPGGSRIVSWDLAKYVNHSCNANSLSTAWGFEIAIRDIAAGEEITDEYGMFNLDEELSCCCGHASCRSMISPLDLERYSDRWDAVVRTALQQASHVDQPLLGLMNGEQRDDLQKYLQTGRRYRSVRSLRLVAPLAAARNREPGRPAKQDVYMPS